MHHPYGLKGKEEKERKRRPHGTSETWAQYCVSKYNVTRLFQSPNSTEWILLNTWDLMVFCPQESYSLAGVGDKVNKQHYVSDSDESPARGRSKSHRSLVPALLILIWSLRKVSHKMQNLSLTLEKERVFDMENWYERPFKAFQVEGGCKYKTKHIDVGIVSVGGSVD